MGMAHLGHVTWFLYHHIGSPLIQMLPIKFDFDWPNDFREEDPLNIMVIYMYNVTGQGQTHNWGPNSFQNLKSPVHLPISFKFCPSNPIFKIFPIQMHRLPLLTLT